MTQFPLSFLYGFNASMAWTTHWVKDIPGIWSSFSEEGGIYLHVYIQKSYVMLFRLAYVQKLLFSDIRDALFSYTVLPKSIGMAKPIYFCLLYNTFGFKIKSEFHHLLFLLFYVNSRKRKAGKESSSSELLSENVCSLYSRNQNTGPALPILL